MTLIKILFVVAVVGTIVFLSFKWNVKLDPPAPIAIAQPQMLVDVVMPAYVIAEQYDADLMHRDPEAYAQRFNSNNTLYKRSLTFVCENGVSVGDTVELSYCSYFNYASASRWDLVSVKPPFYEREEQTESKYIEYLKGVVKAIH